MCLSASACQSALCQRAYCRQVLVSQRCVKERIVGKCVSESSVRERLFEQCQRAGVCLRVCVLRARACAWPVCLPALPHLLSALPHLLSPRALPLSLSLPPSRPFLLALCARPSVYHNTRKPQKLKQHTYAHSHNPQTMIRRLQI